MRYAVAIGYPLRLYVERDRAVQEIERQDCRVTLSSEQAMRWGGLSMWRELREEEKPAAEVLTALGAAASGDSAAEVLSALAQCVPVRQGFCLPAEEGAALLANLPLLEEFGFYAEDFGGGALVVRQAPFDVDPGDIEDTLLEIGGRLLTTGRADPSAARDELFHTMACKAAIKGGWRTSPQELEKVAGAVMRGEVKYCPHGRPVAIELTRKDLEKQFRRA